MFSYLNSILYKIGTKLNTKNILLKYKSDLEAEDLTKDERDHIKSEMVKVLKNTLTTFEVEYLDEKWNEYDSQKESQSQIRQPQMKYQSLE